MVAKEGKEEDKQLAKSLEEVGERRLGSRIYSLLACIELQGMEKEKERKVVALVEKAEKPVTKKQVKRAFQAAWVAFLKLDFDKSVYRGVLGILGGKFGYSVVVFRFERSYDLVL